MKSLYCLLYTILLSSSLHVHAAGIFQIGDSQSYGVFGERWQQRVSVYQWWEQSFFIIARGGSTATSWLNYQQLHLENDGFRQYNENGSTRDIRVDVLPPLRTLLGRYAPNKVIIQLGGNMVWQSSKEQMRSINRLLSMVKDSGTKECFWIGPPNGWARPQEMFKNFYDLLEKALKGSFCTLIDSRPFTVFPEGEGDGIHFDSLGKEKAATFVDQWIDGIFPIIFKNYGNSP